MQNGVTHLPYGICVKSSVELAWDETIWLDWDEEIGWYDPYAGRAEDLYWNPESGWFDPLASFKEYQLTMARLEAREPKLTPWGWLRSQVYFLKEDFLMWMRNTTYHGRQRDLEFRRENRRAQLHAYFRAFTGRLSKILWRRPMT